MREELIESLKDHQALFGLTLAEIQLSELADYYELIQAANPLLHLVAPCSPTEFATRHILESLTLLEFLPDRATFADVGTGAGLPAVPCLIVRKDLRAALIESKPKKAEFLTNAAGSLGLNRSVNIVNKQFEETSAGQTSFVTCRALDGFTRKLPRLIKWSGGRSMLLFGGPTLRDELKRLGCRFTERLMPLSEQRFLFACSPAY